MIRVTATLLSVLCAFITACSIHPTRGGEVGVYRPPDDDVKTGAQDDGTNDEGDGSAQVQNANADANRVQVQDANADANRVKDANTGWRDAPFETLQDSGQCVAKDYLVVSKAQKPLAVYVVVDGTSAIPLAAPVWSFVLLSDIVASPDSWGISSMGFQFVAPDAQCDSAFDVPLSPIVSLAENQVTLAAISLSMVSRLSLNLYPVSGTTVHPILPALQGAIQYVKSYAQLHPDDEVVLWLLTDGLPQGCDSTVENVAQAAAAALSPPFPIATYVLGIDASGAGDLQSLDQIALNGGTEKATFVGLADAMISPISLLITPGSNPDALVFLDVVSEQSRSPLPCEYALPPTDQNEPVDLDLINVYFTPNGGQKTLVYNVAGADSCDPTEVGWFYNATRSSVISCDKTCETLKSTPGEVTVELGCPTIVL